MPSFAHRSRLRAISDYGTLTLKVQHRLVAGSPSDRLHSITKMRFPECVDIRLSSNVVVTLSGTLDSSKIPSEDILMSSLGQHLVDYFQANAGNLGLGSVSKLYLDDEDGLPKLALTSSRHIPPHRQLLSNHVTLIAFDLTYSWQTSYTTASAQSTETQLATHPFSKRLSLPFRTLLDDIVERFVTWQLVKRYPLIFGPWCQQLDTETSYFPSIFSSILTILKRSPNSDFRAQCRNLVKVIHHRHMTTAVQSSTSLATYLRAFFEVDPLTFHSDMLSDEAALCMAMEQIYRDGMRRRQFKGLSRVVISDRNDDEELSQDQTLFSHDSTTSEDQTLWESSPKCQEEFSCAGGNPVLFCDSRGSSPSNIELGYDTEASTENEHWGDNGDWFMGSVEDLEGCYFEADPNLYCISRHNVNDSQNSNCDITPVPLELWHNGPFLPAIQTKYGDADQVELAESEIQHPSQVLGQSEADQLLQATNGHVVYSERCDETLSISPPSIQLMLRQDDSFSVHGREDEAFPRSQFQSVPRIGLYENPEEPVLDDSIDFDADLDLVSDAGSTDSHSGHAILDDDLGAEQSDQDENLAPASGLLLIRENLNYSHRYVTPMVTCLHDVHQLEQYQDEGEDWDRRFGEGANAALDMGSSAEPPVSSTEDYVEDALLVMDF